ncbi:hypothetical protein F5Y01DRAFT_210235 [Xylaria sp. FL0043]|nr:hypothetical protein F5Y01DRAFT_210235 [Xylaria sp. FL0043]
MDRDPRSRRYDDGEVTRYGAGESYRPYNSNRSPRRARSPPPRERPRSPPPDSDRYVPDRGPRRRSRSTDRYRRDPSRDRRDLRDIRDIRDARDVRDVRDTGGDSWRRDDRSRALRRSPRRRSPPRRSPLRRSPPPRRFSPRRDDRDRPRSPRRGFDPRLNPVPQPDNPNTIPLTKLPHRRRSRSPFDRDRPRDRTPPPRRSPPPISRASTYRGRDRTPDRRGDDRAGPSSYVRRPSPPRESAISSTLPSRDTSQRSSPRPDPPRRDDRSRPETPLPPRPISRSSHGGSGAREKTPQRTPQDAQSGPSRLSRSPPRGPAALRAPPTGPRESRVFGGQSAGSIGPPARPAAASTPSPVVSRQENGAGVPPTGPRGFVSGRGGGYGRGGRGGSTWGSTIQSRNLPTAQGPASASTTTSSNSIPIGPRAGSTSQSVPSTPIPQAKPFNPPKGPAAESNRPSLAQQLMASMPAIVPGGKMDPSYIPLTTGVLPELQPHMDRLKEEEEKLREEKYIKEEKLRKSLAAYEKGERETKVMALRTELAEQSLKKFAGEGLGGAAF